MQVPVVLLMVCVPFDQVVVEAGVYVALAVNLFKAGNLSTGMAVRVARMSRLEFTELVRGLGVPVVGYWTGDLAVESAHCAT